MIAYIGSINSESLKMKLNLKYVRIPVIVLLAGAIFFTGITEFNNSWLLSVVNAFAQETPRENAINTSNKINISLDSVNFAPLSDNTFNQLKVLVNYQTYDPNVVHTPMGGIMKVYQSDGTLLKTSSIPKGYVVGQSGIVQFATSFADKTIQDVRVEIHMLDTLDNIISNTISTEVFLTK
jgi:membrane peptidoglycan carboxypeptidase